MTAEALRIFEKASLNMAWYNRLVENREVIAEQLDAMAYIMEDCAKKQKNITEECRSNLQDIAYRARERGIKVIDEQLWEKENGRWQLVMKVMVKDGCVTTRELTKAVAGALNRRMIPEKDTKTLIGKGVNLYTYEEEPRFQAIYGVARMVKDGAAVSGDNFSFWSRKVENGHVLIGWHGFWKSCLQGK